MKITVNFKTIREFGLWMVLALMVVLSCQETMVGEDPLFIPETRSMQNYHCFVEVPAGDNIPISYDISCHCLDTLKVNNQWATLPYLPYPVNRGFIPVKNTDGTLIKIPVWVLGKRLPAGSSAEVRLLGYMDYTEDNIKKSEVLAVPVSNALITVPVQKFKDFIIEYDAVKYALEHWLRNRNGLGRMTHFQWEDEQKAKEFVENQINNNTG